MLASAVVLPDPLGPVSATDSPALSSKSGRGSARPGKDATAFDSATDAGPSSGAARVPVSLSGVAQCKVDAGYGSILPGDLLTTSPTAGHAMRADEPAPGTILGKALEPLDAGTGLIRVLVMLR